LEGPWPPWPPYRAPHASGPKNEDPRTAIAVSGRTLNNLRYADDIVLIANTPTEGKAAYT